MKEFLPTEYMLYLEAFSQSGSFPSFLFFIGSSPELSEQHSLF